jgi:hypothetical protein
MKIEKGIEMPPDGRGLGSTVRLGKWQKVAKEMAVGDSIFFAGEKNNRSFSALSKCLKKMGYKPATRWVGDGHRVWRAE